MIFGSKLLISFLMSAIHCTLFSSAYASTSRHRQVVVTLKIQLIHNSGLDHLCATHISTPLHPSLSFNPYFGNFWARIRSINQPLC